MHVGWNHLIFEDNTADWADVRVGGIIEDQTRPAVRTRPRIVLFQLKPLMDVGNPAFKKKK